MPGGVTCVTTRQLSGANGNCRSERAVVRNDDL